MARPVSATRHGRHVRPRVYLHVGEPKTATTFVQQVLWARRRELAEHGVRVPGTSQQGVFRGVQDLRGVVRRADDPAPAWDGEWDRLARQALRTPRVSVISHELLCAADDAQAARAVESLRGAQVHVVLTVRDMASLLPAEWQESVKHRSTRGWDDWLGDVIDKEFAVENRRDFWFWRVHDTAAVLDLWHRHVPRSHIHVLTVPPRGTERGTVWQRFAEVLDVPAGALDTDSVRSNESLGLPEVELLRRLNCTLSPDVPGWSYMANVKEPLAHGVLAQRPSIGRLELPTERLPWAAAYADRLIGHLDDSGYHVIGSLEDLRPAAPSGDALHPADVTDEQLLGAAVAASAGLLVRRHHRSSGHTAAPGGLLLGALRSAPGVRRRLYALSERNRLVGAARTTVRHRIERRRTESRRDAG